MDSTAEGKLKKPIHLRPEQPWETKRIGCLIWNHKITEWARLGGIVLSEDVD